VAELLEPWANGRPISDVAYLRGGLMNRNYRVRVGSDDVVLRFYDRNRKAAPTEAAILRATEGIVAVPKLLYTAVGADPTPFAILEFVDAISLREVKARGDRDAVVQSAYDAGRQLAALGTVPIDPSVIGEPDIDPNILAGSNVNARLIEHFVGSPILRRRLDDATAERVREFAWRRDELLAPYASTRSLAHGDFNSPNVLVQERENVWSVAAILDWEFAFLGHAYYDIGNFLRYERPGAPRFEPWFSRGLTDGGFDLPVNWLAIARLADLGALCELMTRPDVPNNVAAELRGLILATLDDASA
jgi:aminoglycoside phosphotransferase (APT) family kinase protein